ncbi:MAG: sigma-70 family RNA polymerase sigma factor [Spirochaetota bacterium]|nr:MAG: sigma-70 family RNA polymerase sigma factor [Spirochaetota bacterium]
MTDRTNEEWLEDLRKSSPNYNEALQDLRDILLRGLRVGLSSRKGIDRDTLEDIVQDALLRIVEKLDSFEGRSRFTTWAMKVAVRVALTELRRRHWKDVSLDKLVEAKGMDLFPTMGKESLPGPEQQTVQSMLMETMKTVISKELTDHQRKALVAVRFHGMPLEEVARKMGTNRNALYKLLHDARLSMQRAMTKKGLEPREVLEAFG